MNTPYNFLVDTYQTERMKILSVWSEFHDDDLPIRPNPIDHRGRSVHEQMVHQCVSENLWFKTMLDIAVTDQALPQEETRMHFIQTYAHDSQLRVNALAVKDIAWWQGITGFFDVPRSRAWIMTRRIAHSSHHRGQLTYLLRMLKRDLHSTYGPTADTGGLMQNNAPTIYLFSDEKSLLNGDSAKKNRLPVFDNRLVTERPA